MATGEAARVGEGALNIPLLRQLLDSGYVASQVLATRRMLDKRQDVVSLRRLINDVRAYKGLITREVYVSFDGTSYKPALPKIEMPGLQPSDSPFSDWSRSKLRQERFDSLSGVEAVLRSRDDLIDDSIFRKLDTWIDSTAAPRLISFSHKYLAHAAEQSSINPAMPTGVSLAEVEGIHRAVAKSMRAIYDIVLSSGIYSEVVPNVPLGFFGKVWDGNQLIPSTARMNKHWDQMADERNRWVRHLESDLFSQRQRGATELRCS